MKKLILSFVSYVFLFSTLFAQQTHFSNQHPEEHNDYYSNPSKVVMTIWSNQFNDNQPRSCQIFGFQHAIASKNMQHAVMNQKEFSLTKRINALSPYFNKFVKKGVSIPRVRITFYTEGPEAQEFQYYSIIFENVKVNMVENYLSDIMKYDPGKSIYHWEQISFSYQKVTWRHDETGNIFTQ